MNFDICIVVHNNLEQFRLCLESVARLSRENHEAQVYVWDNGSDDRQAFIEIVDDIRLIPWMEGVELETSEANHGFSLSAHLLARKGSGDIIWFLNPDVTVGPDTMDKFGEAFELWSNVAVAGPRGQCRTILADGTGAAREAKDYIEGACMVVRRARYMEVGGFDHERYRFAYCEDADLCLKLRQRGYEMAEVDINQYTHARASTADLVRERGTVDVDGYAVINRLRLQSRWQEYMARWTFDRNLVLARSAAIGDCLQLTAVARALKSLRPTWRLYADTYWNELFENNPLISAWDGSNVGRVEFVGLDGAYEGVPKSHMVTGYLSGLGLGYEASLLPPVAPELYFTDKESEMWTPGYAVVHADPTGWPGRDWPVERFNAIAERLSDRMRVVQVGAVKNPDTELFFAEDLRGLPLRDSMALIAGCSLFVGIDSFPSNVAAACGRPGVVLFGCINPALRLPADTRLVGLTAPSESMVCLGCHHEYPAPCVASGCSRNPEQKIADCMEHVTVDMVMEAVDGLDLSQ